MTVIRARTMDIKQMSVFSVTKQTNFEKNEKEALQGSTVLESFPRRIVCEMTSACNIHCKMCGREATNFKATFFDPKWLEFFEPVTDRIGEITLLGWGEPTLHPNFADFLKWGYEHDLQKFFCTNGTRLHLIKDAIFDYNTELLTVSLDGACAETNNRIRCGADFDTVVGNIKELVAEKKRRGTEFPYLSIVMTMMESNYQEMPDYVRLAADMGIQEIKGVYLTVFEQRLMDEMMYDHAQEMREVFSKTAELGEQLGVQVKLPYIQGEDVAGNKAHKDCYVGWRDFFLGSDGYVRSCMSTPHKLFHISKYETFDAAWNSPEYQEFRRTVNTSEMPQGCLNCYQASFANWNRKGSFIQVGNEFAPEWEG